MVNKFGFIGKSSDTFGFTKTLPCCHFSHKFALNFGLFCVLCCTIPDKVWQFWSQPLPPVTAASHCQVFVCFLRKLSSRVKREAPKGPPPSTSVKSRQSFQILETQSFQMNPRAAMYQWNLCLCDKRVIPHTWTPANTSSVKSLPFDFSFDVLMILMICANLIREYRAGCWSDWGTLLKWSW